MQGLPGFRDFLPNDCAARNYIFARWREVAHRYGFVEWEGPVLEPTELYKKKSGAEIVDQLFNFTDKGEREVALRPELTPTLARVVAAHEREFKKPLKWFSVGPFFRYEKQQRGRLREHFQLNCDIIGETDLTADIELIALSIDILRGFGLNEKDFVVRMSDREFWTDFLKSQDVPENRWQEILQVIDKSEREPREKTTEKLGALADPILTILKEGGRSEKLGQLVEGLRVRGLDQFVDVDVRIVRGLAYYTGVVFEVFDRGGKLRAIAGGGRYDNLIENLSDGAVKLPALGFAMGDVVLAELIRDRAAAHEKLETAIRAQTKIDIYIVIAKEERRAYALAEVQKLREGGYRVDYPLAPAKVGKQFQAAEDLGATVAILYGDEWPEVKMKTLATREETLVDHKSLLDSVGKLVNVSAPV
jgi:histidyl-tRNA synthetase